MTVLCALSAGVALLQSAALLLSSVGHKTDKKTRRAVSSAIAINMAGDLLMTSYQMDKHSHNKKTGQTNMVISLGIGLWAARDGALTCAPPPFSRSQGLYRHFFVEFPRVVPRPADAYVPRGVKPSDIDCETTFAAWKTHKEIKDEEEFTTVI